MREWRAVVAVLGIVMAALMLASAARFGLVEPAAMAVDCDAARWQGVCALRSLVIEAFVDHRLGLFALAAALLATLWRRRWLAGVALAAGSAGLVLYSAGLAAAAVLLALLVFVRSAAAR